ncbi:MAG: T9SS type A sorting domain-containing protein, partial [Sphingobacteriia bacterium]
TTVTITGAGNISFTSTSAAVQGVEIQWSENGTSGWAANGSSLSSPSYLVAAGTSITRYARRFNTSTQCFSPSVTLTGTATAANGLTGGMIGSSQTICAGSDPAAFSSSTAASGGTGMLSYQWQSSANMNGPFSAIMGTNSTTYDLPMQNMAGTTYYRRRVTDANQAEAFSNVINVVVNALPTTPVLAVQARIGAGNVQFSYGGTLGTNEQLQWSSDNVTFGTPGATSPAFAVTEGGRLNFYARIVNTQTQCASAVTTVTGTAYKQNTSVTITQAAGSNSLNIPVGINPVTGTIQWLDANLEAIANATGVTFTPTANGTYYVSYRDANGDYQVSNAISFVAATTARTASLAAGGIQLYPNPSQGQLNVVLATPGSYSLQLTDLQGRVVYTTALSATGTTTSLQLPSLPVGLYSVQIGGASGTYSGKLSVQ